MIFCGEASRPFPTPLTAARLPRGDRAVTQAPRRPYASCHRARRGRLATRASRRRRRPRRTCPRPYVRRLEETQDRQILKHSSLVLINTCWPFLACRSRLSTRDFRFPQNSCHGSLEPKLHSAAPRFPAAQDEKARRTRLTRSSSGLVSG